MEGDDKRAQRALERGIAAIAREKYPEQISSIETKAKNRVKNNLGVEPETATKALAILKLAADASQGEVNEDIGGLGVNLKYTPDEQAIMLRKSWDF